ncbi:hypothetical protein [Streptomyces sp. 35G-GA-8]|uniref:hypothetical protein n=1 Tax=Streptomyces sp. 35G-GA-8 TaxID=2939434 RepID=UPI00201EB391|nr:hypothetical protein [Streptomyces sp. 35G-GA-8]MCL7377034.1 hypothetical protein [Streptomyces sp. 35G-GA-8]
MPSSDAPQHPTAVHQILQHAHARLVACVNGEEPPLTQLLARAADHLSAEEREHLGQTSLAWAVAEAACQLLTRCRIPIGPGDPNVPYCLKELDRLPRTARIGLLTVAIRYTTPDPTTLPTTRIPAPDRHRAARGRITGPCACPCNSGGFCHGCGHGGCGGRR